MKNRLKKLSSLIVVAAVLMSMFSMPVHAAESEYQMGWDVIGGIPVPKSIQSDTAFIQYEYDEDAYRKSKTVDGISTYFVYEDNVLVEEFNENYHIRYTYKTIENDFKAVTGFLLDGKAYTYMRDSYNVITGILDADGSCVARYAYDEYGNVSGAFGYLDGIWADKSSDADFIGNKNHLVSEGSYFDRETGWHYQYRRYYDLEAGSFITDGTPVDILELSTFRDMISEITNISNTLYNQLMTNGTHGMAIPASSDWHSGLSEVEIIARLIYGEASNALDQIIAVSHVVMNRLESSEFPPLTFQGICLQSGQFAAMTGTTSDTNQARNPDTSSKRWRSATNYACLLVTAQVKSIYELVAPPPKGYVGQCFFVSSRYFKDNTRNVDWETGFGEYKLGGTFYGIKNITNLEVENGNVFFSYQ